MATLVVVADLGIDLHPEPVGGLTVLPRLAGELLLDHERLVGGLRVCVKGEDAEAVDVSCCADALGFKSRIGKREFRQDADVEGHELGLTILRVTDVKAGKLSLRCWRSFRCLSMRKAGVAIGCGKGCRRPAPANAAAVE